MRVIAKKGLLAAYAAVWAAILVCAWIYWNDLNWIEKAILVLGEIVLAPDLSSLRHIFFSKREG